MKKLISSITMMFFAFGIASCQSSDAYKTVREKEFTELTKTPNAVILDVRTPEEYAEGHIENAKLMNYYGDNFNSEVSKLDKNKTYLVYCKSGGRSSEASTIMAEKGYKVFNLSGGISNWVGKVVK